MVTWDQFAKGVFDLVSVKKNLALNTLEKELLDFLVREKFLNENYEWVDY